MPAHWASPAVRAGRTAPDNPESTPKRNKTSYKVNGINTQNAAKPCAGHRRLRGGRLGYEHALPGFE